MEDTLIACLKGHVKFFLEIPFGLELEENTIFIGLIECLDHLVGTPDGRGGLCINVTPPIDVFDGRLEGVGRKVLDGMKKAISKVDKIAGKEACIKITGIGGILKKAKYKFLEV